MTEREWFAHEAHGKYWPGTNTIYGLMTVGIYFATADECQKFLRGSADTSD